MADGPDERVSSDVSPIESVLSEVSPNEQVPSDASPVEPVPSDDGEASTDADELWVRQWDAQAAAFFYLNPRTQEATWERPAGYVDTMAPEDDEGRGLLQEQAVDCSAPEVGDSQAEMAGAAVKIQSVYRGHGARKQQRQRQWIEQFDPSTGQMYYHNVSTGESKWERPRDFVAGVRDAKSEGIVKIQSAFRGKQTRDQIKQQSVSAHSTDEGASTQVGCDERDLAAASADNFRLEAAATIIQCAVRKRKASKRMEIRKERLRTLTDVGVMDQKARDLRQAIDELQAEVCARSMSGPEEAALFPHLVGLLSSWNPAIATMKDHYLALSGQIALISAAETVAARIEYAEQCHEAIGSVRDQCIALLRGVLLMNSYFVELDVHRINVACTAFANLKKNDLCALSDPRMRKIVQIEDLYASFALAEGSLRQAMGLTDFTICATTATGKKFEEFHPQVVAALDHMRELELRVAHKVELLHLYRKRQQVRDETTLMEHEDALATQVERVQRQRLTDQEERIKFLHRCRESWQKGIVQRRNDMRCQQNQEESRRHEDMQHRVRMEKMKMQELEQRKKVKLSIWEAVKEGMPVETIQSMLFAEVQKARRHGYEFSVMTARSERGETLLQIACWWGHENLVSFLINEGANINVIDSRANKFSLLHDAARRGHTRIIRVLLEHELPLDARDSWGDTPLHWACRRNHYDAVILLLGGHSHPLDEHTTAAITKALRSKNNRGKSPYNVTRSETIRRVLNAAEAGNFPRVRLSLPSPTQLLEVFSRRKTIPALQETQGLYMKKTLQKSKTSANFLA